MGKIQNIYPIHFSGYKVRYTQKQVRDITEKDEQDDIVAKEHMRAHRNAAENKLQIISKFFFPSLRKKTEATAKACETCKLSKYDRHPNNGEMQPTPIPTYPGQVIHIDIYTTQKQLVLTAIDKFSKYAQIKMLKSKASEDLKHPLREIMIAFGMPKLIVMDNEKAFNSANIKFLLQEQLKASVYTTPPYSSTSNGQVERFHSTLTEIMRCLSKDSGTATFEEIIFKAVQEYNASVHSTTKAKPIDIFFGHRQITDPQTN